jgi:hypothetical protein
MGINQWPHRMQAHFDPDATLDYQLDWSSWLTDGEVIANSTWTVSGADQVTASFSDTRATIWLRNPTGKIISATNKITTNSAPVPRIDERTLLITVSNN